MGISINFDIPVPKCNRCGDIGTKILPVFAPKGPIWSCNKCWNEYLKLVKERENG